VRTPLWVLPPCQYRLDTLNPQFAGNMLPAEAFQMRKVLSTLSLARPRQNAGAILKNYVLFI
jgi:hypothetical protein